MGFRLTLAIQKRLKAEQEARNSTQEATAGLTGSIRINMNSKLFQETEVKTKMTPLQKFLNTYNFYIKKLLWINADPFLSQKHEQYLARLESQNQISAEHKYYANVFNRLEIDTKEKVKKIRDKKNNLLSMKSQNNTMKSGSDIMGGKVRFEQSPTTKNNKSLYLQQVDENMCEDQTIIELEDKLAEYTDE